MLGDRIFQVYCGQDACEWDRVCVYVGAFVYREGWTTASIAMVLYLVQNTHLWGPSYPTLETWKILMLLGHSPWLPTHVVNFVAACLGSVFGVCIGGGVGSEPKDCRMEEVGRSDNSAGGA